MIRRHVIVSGTVQGVGYRWSARSEATRIGVGGWVRNLQDGRVEAEVEGDEESVERMLDWLARGPVGANVAQTVVTDAEPLGATAFTIEH